MAIYYNDSNDTKKIIFYLLQEFMKQKIEEHFKKDGLEATVKYIEPSYMIRYVLV